jgi:S-DNA-T family DNA segregation ATPase FtsK/SpoIIIE
MANLFDKLPHLLGTITNLDGAQSMRALVAIKSELRRRQTVLGNHNVNHIDSYQKLCAKDSSLEPMPHLFIISDEFAELKREQPDFIKELVSAARIGRSLGVHLILATQKPSGVVDDQIWSNSNFRICLKVQDASDSNEMIKTPDAADIKLPGRGYLQVGNNEIYELFQSAYSGAEYHPDTNSNKEELDYNIYLWNELGQAQLMTYDFSALIPDKAASANPLTQLDVTIQAIEQTFTSLSLKKVPSPWLPPLEEILFLPDLLDNSSLQPGWAGKSESGKVNADIEIIVGMVDEVEQQSQSPLTINFTTDGHVGIFGSASTGKSTFLRTIALSLALKYTPNEAVFIALDFGNNALLPLQSLPHTADVLTLDDTEKLGKLERLLIKEMKRRKDILGASRVSSITMHNKISKEPVPALFVMIDNIDIVREQSISDLENLLRDISRDGQALSIYIIFASTKPATIRFNILGHIRNFFVFYMNDKADIHSTVGRTDLQSESIPGRGLTNASSVYSFQAALPTYGRHEEERIHTFQQATETLANAWSTPLPFIIPMMPDIVTLEEFYTVPSVKAALESKNKKLPIALDNENLEVFCLDFDKYSHVTITGDHNLGKTNLIKVIIEALSRKEPRFYLNIVDDGMNRLQECHKRYHQSTYMTIAEEFPALLAALATEINERKQEYVQKSQAKETTLNAAAYYATLRPYLIIVNNIANFLSKLNTAQHTELATLLDDSRITGIHFCFVSNLQDFPKTFDRLPTAIKNIPIGITLLPLTTQNAIQPVPTRFPTVPPPLKPGEANYIHSGSAALIKIPLVPRDSDHE